MNRARIRRWSFGVALSLAWMLPRDAAAGTLQPDNIARPSCDAILLMSSQKVDANEEVEKIADGDFGTKWTSEAGTFPNWVEIRWPQPVALNKLVVDEDPAGRSGQFRVDAFLDDGWKTLVGPTVNVTPSGRTVTFGPVVATRIRLRIKPEATLLPGHVLARNISPGHVLVAHPWEYDTTPYAIGPMFYVHDARAEPLGTYTYNRTRVAYAAKTVRGARSIYLGVPYLDSVVLRQICRVAGVHLYAREDVYVDASQNYLMILRGPMRIQRRRAAAARVLRLRHRPPRRGRQRPHVLPCRRARQPDCALLRCS